MRKKIKFKPAFANYTANMKLEELVVQDIHSQLTLVDSQSKTASFRIFNPFALSVLFINFLFNETFISVFSTR